MSEPRETFQVAMLKLRIAWLDLVTAASHASGIPWMCRMLARFARWIERNAP